MRKTEFDNNDLKLNVYGIKGQSSSDSLYVCKNQNLNCKDVVLELDVETKNAEVTDLENVFANDASGVDDDVVKASDDKKIFKSTSVDPVKAIIVLPKQFDKLKGSKFTQEALLNVRNSSIGSFEGSEDLESLSNKVTELYNSGNVEEAEALLEKISALNSKNEVEEDGNVLVKH